MNPFGNSVLYLLGYAIACLAAMVASFGFGVLAPWLGIVGGVAACAAIVFVFYVLANTRFT